jgi:ABC-type polysaccharide/polyol phosphate transport system ATPase subunit
VLSAATLFIGGGAADSPRFCDMDTRIHLDDVSIRFRMSYHKVASLAQVLSEVGRRLTRKWNPEYFTALAGINLKVGTGEIVGVVGRNGSGKSTLLRTISGIYYPDSGTVSVSGRVSALLQLGTGFNTLLNGRDNIVLGGLTLGLSRDEIDARMDMIIEFAELGEFIDVPMRYYSSGMMSRLSFAMVVSLEPDILLIDETLSVGDLGFQKKSRAAMHRLLEHASCQMIVSHDMSTIERLCTRAILVEKGRIVLDDSPEVVIREYQQLQGVTPDEPSIAAQVQSFATGWQ